MGHLGLQPQAIHNLGGKKVQGKEKAAAEQILVEANELQRVGCFSLVLECIHRELGKCVTHSLKIPTIVIGAGPETDGQVLVLHDLLGLDENFSPKFLRKYANLHKVVSSAVDKYHSDVQSCQFPSVSECY
jgi:3-methyl-2-oxobutanoate hydroxymethyltransferase